jgi:transcriptional regulator with GAF, ATPase, and Fis domain
MSNITRTDILPLADNLHSRLSRFTRRHYRLTDTEMVLPQSKNHSGNIRELRNDLLPHQREVLTGGLTGHSFNCLQNFTGANQETNTSGG